MKRFAAFALSVIMTAVNAMAANVTVKLNNEEVSFPAQAPVIVEGRTLIPLRSIFESLGYEIQWQADTKTALLESDSSKVTITANAESFEANGRVIALDTPAQIINGSMMLPLRAIGEASGLSVSWNNETKEVLLNTRTAEASKSVGNEMQLFFDNLKSYEKIDHYLMEISYSSMANGFDIMDGISKKTLAYTRAAEKIAALNAYYDKLYEQAETFKASEDYKSAKGTLLDIIKLFKKSAECDKNYFDGLYISDDDYYNDGHSIMEEIENHNSSLSLELARLDNQYMQTMYKYFDTEKDTEENKANIAEFIEEIGSIDSKYPIPSYEDIYDDEDNYIADNMDKNAEDIRKAAEGRKTAFEALNAPHNCRERLELILCSNEVLNDMADAFEGWKAYGSEEYNPYEVEIEYNIALYDIISTLASDTKLTRINMEDDEEFDFETHTDESYNTIETDGISQETQDFVNKYYYLTAMYWFLEENELRNDYYSYLMATDKDKTSSTKNIKAFFESWRSSQNYNLDRLKEYTVNEALMAAKSAAINYINIDISYTYILEKIYSKLYSEAQYETEKDETVKKLEAARESFDGEASRINTLLDKYIYDYCYPDEVRTENSEIQKFGEAVEEINQKYPIKENINAVYGSTVDGSIIYFDNSDIKTINSKADDICNNIANRENEYKNIDIPESCKMRAELIYAADDLVLEHVKLCRELKSNDDSSAFNYTLSQNVLWQVYDALLAVATGGEAESIHPENYIFDQQ